LAKENFVRLLEQCAGRKTMLAGWLGVSRQTVHNWCRYYGIGKAVVGGDGPGSDN
jgi:transcriptional regulator of acetoin/glycerol metabolism